MVVRIDRKLRRGWWKGGSIRCARSSCRTRRLLENRWFSFETGVGGRLPSLVPSSGDDGSRCPPGESSGEGAIFRGDLCQLCIDTATARWWLPIMPEAKAGVRRSVSAAGCTAGLAGKHGPERHDQTA